MPPFETFAEEVYVMSQHFVATQLAPEPVGRGRKPALDRAAVLTLALLSQLQRFASERDFYRYADRWLRWLVPTLPDRSQVNRAIRRHRAELDAFGQWCAAQAADRVPYELLDTTAKPLRNRQRRGTSPLAPLCAVGRSLRLDIFHGVRVLVAITPEGLITGTHVGPGNRNDRPLTETFLAERAAAVPTAAGDRPASGIYLADTGFAGRQRQAHWQETYGAEVIAPPQPDSRDRWSEERQREHRRLRQRIETVIGRLLHDFRLERDRPKTVPGLLSRLAAKVALHNVVLWSNRLHDRPRFVIAEVIEW